ncbi:MAG TPA: SDR family oxidoreductase [Hyphomicrobium sp.]|nr:SDR family oxidoreductase [Hyphomicrobium sp.]
MKIDLSGKTALVTGSTGGIGFAIAKGLAGAGARVLINGRKADRVAAAISRLERDVTGGKFLAAPGDVATADGCASIVEGKGDIDILVNNAAIFEPKDFFDIPDADWTRYFETNVLSGIRLSRELMPAMLGRNWGRIVFISSESAVQIPKEFIHYGFTKTAELAISRGLAELSAGSNVTVNSVLPGPTRSDGVEGFLEALAAKAGISTGQMAKNFVQRHRPSSLIQRFATVDEVANMVVYVCSREASATNGAALRVDGGVVRSIV